MPRFESDSDVRRLGEALAALRREAGLSQAEAGERLGMTSQGWGLYESGQRPGLFRPDVQRRFTTAIGASPEALALKLADSGAVPAEPSENPAVAGMQSLGRSYAGPPAGTTRRLQLSNDDLSPWAASGVVLEYEPGRWPRRDQGCVIEMADGEVRVRLYDSADAEALTVRGVRGGEERIARAATRQVSAVVARLDL